MNVDTFAKVAEQTEVYKRCATLIQNITDTNDAPDLTAVNAYLQKKKETYKGLQIILIDQDITLELADGTQITKNPFEDDVILFSESKVLGNTFWKKPIDATKKAGDVAEKVMPDLKRKHNGNKDEQRLFGYGNARVEPFRR